MISFYRSNFRVSEGFLKDPAGRSWYSQRWIPGEELFLWVNKPKNQRSMLTQYLLLLLKYYFWLLLLTLQNRSRKLFHHSYRLAVLWNTSLIWYKHATKMHPGSKIKQAFLWKKIHRKLFIGTVTGAAALHDSFVLSWRQDKEALWLWLHRLIWNITR